MNCLVNFVYDRDLILLVSVKLDSYVLLLGGTLCVSNARKF